MIRFFDAIDSVKSIKFFFINSKREKYMQAVIWDTLPYDVRNLIFHQLPSQDLLSASLVSSGWKLQLDKLWKEMIPEKDLIPKNSPTLAFKKIVVARCCLDEEEILSRIRSFINKLKPNERGIFVIYPNYKLEAPSGLRTQEEEKEELEVPLNELKDPLKELRDPPLTSTKSIEIKIFPQNQMAVKTCECWLRTSCIFPQSIGIFNEVKENNGWGCLSINFYNDYTENDFNNLDAFENTIWTKEDWFTIGNDLIANGLHGGYDLLHKEIVDERGEIIDEFSAYRLFVLLYSIKNTHNLSNSKYAYFLFDLHSKINKKLSKYPIDLVLEEGQIVLLSKFSDKQTLEIYTELLEMAFPQRGANLAKVHQRMLTLHDPTVLTILYLIKNKLSKSG